MNSRVLILLAVLLLLGASVAAYLGYQTTVEAREAVARAEAKAAEVAKAKAEGQAQVVVVTRPVAAFQTLAAEDVSVDFLKAAPPNTFSRPEDVIGLPVQTDLVPGTLLDNSHLNAGGDVARLLRPGERAVAIPVDAVVGSGGFVQPGDLVDILLFMSGRDGKPESAQVVMRALRVLSYGDTLITPPGTVTAPKEGEEAKKDDAEAQQASTAQRVGARTAVLAVAKDDVTRLLLANSLGALRLAIVPTAEMISPEALTKSAIQPLPEVAVSSVSSKPSAVPEQRQYLTANVLQGGVVRSTPVVARSRGGSAKPSAPAEPPVLIYRGLNSEAAK